MLMYDLSRLEPDTCKKANYHVAIFTDVADKRQLSADLKMKNLKIETSFVRRSRRPLLTKLVMILKKCYVIFCEKLSVIRCYR